MKAIVRLIVILMVICVSFSTHSLAEDYTYNQIVETIDLAIAEERVVPINKSEGKYYQNFTGIVISWSEANQDIYFDYTCNDSDKNCSWQLPEFSSVVPVMKSIGPLWYDFINIEKDGCMILYYNDVNNKLKTYVYAPKVDLSDYVSQKAERLDSIESFINIVVDLANTHCGGNETPVDGLLRPEKPDENNNQIQANDKTDDGHTYILDQGNVQIYINGKAKYGKVDEWSSEQSIIIPVVVVNNTKESITIYIEKASMNGWSIYADTSIFEVPAGKKSKDTLHLRCKEAEVTKYSDFEDAEFVFRIINCDTYRDIFISDTVKILASDFE